MSITNKLNVIEQIIRNKVYNCLYWKNNCFGLDENTLIDKALDLKYIGGVINSLNQPSDFICLVVKMIQLGLKEDAIDVFLSMPEHKYLRAVTAFYVRLTFPAVKVYMKLEAMYSDYRKLRVCSRDGKFSIIHMDEYVDDLIMKEMVFDITLPAMPKRTVLENRGELLQRVSLLEVDDGDGEGDDDRETGLNGDDIFEDIKIPDEFFKGKKKRYNKDDDEGEGEADDNRDDGDDFVFKKQKISESKVNMIKRESNEDKGNDINEKKLDENSAEYWLELRKKAFNL